MNAVIESCLSQLQLGEMQCFDWLAIFPLFCPLAGGPDYLTLSEAMEKGVISVTEKDLHGSVPELKVKNRAKIGVLLLDGEELEGAKQNRVVNTTILLREMSETLIPVSCTEHGRWSYTNPEFIDSGVVMPSRLRGQKSCQVSMNLIRCAVPHSDQGAVWDGIAEMSERAGVRSQTGAMKNVFESLDRKLEDCMGAFPCLPSQKGILVMIHGEPVGLDFLSREQAYARIHTRLVKSYAIDALLEQGSGKPTEKRAKEFLDSALNCEDREFDSIGSGKDHRLHGRNVVGSALVVDDTVIHTAFFATEGSVGESPTRIHHFKIRRNFRVY